MGKYAPDNWVIIKIILEDGEALYKVLAGWSGGYLDGDSWRMNSGITGVEEDGDYYNIKGFSGSVYRCHKEQETLRASTTHIWERIKESRPTTEIIPIRDIIFLKPETRKEDVNG